LFGRSRPPEFIVVQPSRYGCAVSNRVQNNGETTGGVTGKGFGPGRSGNPGGRPQGLARATRELLGNDGLGIATFWRDVMVDASKDTRVRLEASRLLAERGWGKPTNFEPIVDDDPSGEGLNLDLATIDREIERLSKELAARNELPEKLI
jgi:hypothetical protein